MSRRILETLVAFAGLTLGASLLSGCTTESYCFTNCDGNSTSGTNGGTTGVGDGGPLIDLGGNGGAGNSGNGPDGATCGTVELCNGKDDNCNGQIDENLDFTDPYQCGICDHNCRQLIKNVDQSQVTCTPPATADLGKVAGTCGYTGACSPGTWDVDGDPTNGCEVECQNDPKATPDKDNGGVCGVDDNCNGKVDEDLDVSSDPKNCGACGHSCVFVNGTGACKAGTCEIDKCDAGWFNPPGGDGCWYKCTPTNNGVEICDGLDNDCDNLIDNADVDITTNETTIGQSCPGGDKGICADPVNAGVFKCVATGATSTVAIACCDQDSNNVTSPNPSLPATGLRNGVCAGTVEPKVIHPGDRPELCNGKDDDCNGQTDENPTDVGDVCGLSQGACSLGVNQCQNGSKVCVGNVAPGTDDPCNGVDDDCDGVIDGTVGATVSTCTSDANCTGTDICMTKASGIGKLCATPSAQVGLPCNPPAAAPCMNAAGQDTPCGTAGAKPVPQPCKAGTFVCKSTLVCQGVVSGTSPKDLCGEDSNCDGRLDNQPNLLTDVANCGTCGNDCNAKGAHVTWSCSNGQCVQGATKCKSGFIDCDTNANDCEVACVKSGTELCNGFDDDCNCKIDDGITAPTPAQVCGVSAGASDPKCDAGNGTTGVKVACSAGKWQCTFPAGYCNQGTPPTCGTTQDVCDTLDNNCNGAIDENFKAPVLTTGALGSPCASDDGKPPPGDGACRGTGTFVCSGAAATKCSATKNSAAAGPELCDGIDNDCDGSIDEPFSAKGTNTTYFLKPAVVQTTAGVWMFQYEASRPSSTSTTAGSGNGYWCTTGNCAANVPAAPAGVTLDKTPACSLPSKIPWFNVTPAEAEETCTAMGGSVCSTPNWEAACTDGAAACVYGYGATCKNTANYSSGPFCNLGPYDYDGVAGAPNSDGVLVTKSPLLNQCYANYGATPASTGLFDITGNLREITKRGTEDYPLMGGAFSTDAESGATCSFDFYSVPSTFKLFDTGFRCCFSKDPTL